MKAPHLRVTDADRDSRYIPVALTFAAVLSVAGVLCFTALALRNERLAVRERLTQVYVNYLGAAQRSLAAHWRERTDRLDALVSRSPAAQFAAIVRSNLATSVVIYDSEGQLAYPAFPSSDAITQPFWAAFQQPLTLEFQRQDLAAAAEAYGLISQQATDPQLKAAAFQAQANCHVKSGNPSDAIEILERLILAPELRFALGAQGVLLAPNAALRVLQLARTPENPHFQTALGYLTSRLNDYDDPLLTSSQRRFLMEEVRKLAPESAFPTLNAEHLAAAYLDLVQDKPAQGELGQFAPTALTEVWKLASGSGSVVALYREAEVRAESEACLASGLTSPEFKVEVFPPQMAPLPPLGPTVELAGILPGWELALQFDKEDPFAAATRQQAAVYMASGGLVAITILTLVLVISRHLRAQMRLTRLKNELISTVTHELKTPLASTRALVETLLAGRVRGARQQSEYLELIANENQRLSHLIENFLTFSRLERGANRFGFQRLAPDVLVRSAVRAMQERLKPPLCQFEQQVRPELPDVRADPDAMTTVLINLLDNALKYTEQDKRIVLRADAQDGDVCFEVQDNGIGFPPEERERIFDRFYQVDQSLTRQRGGCGLGLSIVRSIVHAHGGRVEVQSRPGQGSVFRVRLRGYNEQHPDVER